MLQAGKEDIGVVVALADAGTPESRAAGWGCCAVPGSLQLRFCGKNVPCSRGISSGPVAGSGVVALAVVLVDGGDLGHKRIVGVRVGQQRADRQENLGDGQSGRPLVLQDVEADGAVGVDVRMVNFRRERDLGRLERIVGREVDVEEEDAARVGRVVRAHDRSLPVELVSLVGGAGGAVGGRVPAQINQFFLDSFKCHNFNYKRVRELGTLRNQER